MRVVGGDNSLKLIILQKVGICCVFPSCYTRSLWHCRLNLLPQKEGRYCAGRKRGGLRLVNMHWGETFGMLDATRLRGVGLGGVGIWGRGGEVQRGGRVWGGGLGRREERVKTRMPSQDRYAILVSMVQASVWERMLRGFDRRRGRRGRKFSHR